MSGGAVQLIRQPRCQGAAFSNRSGGSRRRGQQRWAGSATPAAPCSQQQRQAEARSPLQLPQQRQAWRVAASVAADGASTSSDAAGDAVWEGRYGSALLHGTAMEQGPREAMEDACQVVPQARCGFLYASVFDGHGGKSASKWLERNLYGVVSESMTKSGVQEECELPDGTDGICCPLALTPVLTVSFQHADQDLLRWLAANCEGEECNSGATATTVLVRGDKVIVANVGDSRAVLCRAGRALNLTTEHRVYGRHPAAVAEAERIESVGGWVDDGRVCGVLAVSRAFGDAEFKDDAGLQRMLQRGIEYEFWDKKFAAGVRFSSPPVTSMPDVTEMSLNDGDEFIVVASDGLWDVMDSQEAVQLARGDLRKGRHPQEVAERLAKSAVKRYTADNVAVVVVDLGKVAWQQPAQKGFLGGLFG